MTLNILLGKTREAGEAKGISTDSAKDLINAPLQTIYTAWNSLLHWEPAESYVPLKQQLASRRNEFHLRSDVPHSWTRHSGVNEALCSRASTASKWILLWPNKNHRLEIVMIQKFSARNRGSCKIFGNCRKYLMVSQCQGEESWPLVFMVLVPMSDNFRRRWLSLCGLSSKE